MITDLGETYESAYVRRSRDGIMILWKTEKLTLINKQIIDFDQLLTDVDPEMELTGRKALLLELRFTDTEQNILISTTHLEWKPA